MKMNGGFSLKTPKISILGKFPFATVFVNGKVRRVEPVLIYREDQGFSIAFLA